jgi:hypothetical protein
VTRALALAVVVLTLTGGIASAATPPSWASVAATLEGGVDPASSNPCTRGVVTCVDVVAKEMRRRERTLAARCDHTAVFADVYRVVTEQFRQGWPRDFTAPGYIANLDAVFAKYYFDTYDRWKRGDEVPPAWSIALDTGRDREAAGVGDMMLGLNAHISRDLPFVIEQVGLTNADGTSALDDFNRANSILVDALPTTLASVSKRFDPDVAHLDVPGFATDEEAFRALITTWRAEAWTRAQQLVDAPTPEDRQAIVDQIESVAATRAVALAAATAYIPFVSSTTERDRYCRAHR